MTNWDSNLGAIPFGLYEKALPQVLTWEQRLVQARSIGFDFVEMSVDDTDERIARLGWTPKERASLLQAVASTGVPVRSLSLSAHRRFPLGSKDSQTRNRGIKILNQAIDLALDLNIRTILLSGAEDYYKVRDEENKGLFLEALGKGFERASGAGVMLALENWDIQIDSLTKVMEYVDHFSSPWFQAYADIGNLIFAGMDLFEELEKARGHIAALHVKDTFPGQLRYVEPGTGKVPFEEAFAKIAEIGYQGPVVLELWTEDFPDAVEQVRKGFAFIKQQMVKGWDLFAARNQP